MKVSEGSRRQFAHPFKPGKVTVAGHPSIEVLPGPLSSILTERTETMKYAVVDERSSTGGAPLFPIFRAVWRSDSRSEKLNSSMIRSTCGTSPTSCDIASTKEDVSRI
jgi:hypothetical protein